MSLVHDLPLQIGCGVQCVRVRTCMRVCAYACVRGRSLLRVNA